MKTVVLFICISLSAFSIGCTMKPYEWATGHTIAEQTQQMEASRTAAAAQRVTDRQQLAREIALQQHCLAHPEQPICSTLVTPSTSAQK